MEVTRQRKHVRKRRASGLCAREGCKESSGKRYLCDKHAEEHRNVMRVRRAKQPQAVAA